PLHVALPICLSIDCRQLSHLTFKVKNSIMVTCTNQERSFLSIEHQTYGIVKQGCSITTSALPSHNHIIFKLYIDNLGVRRFPVVVISVTPTSFLFLGLGAPVTQGRHADPVQ